MSSTAPASRSLIAFLAHQQVAAGSREVVMAELRAQRDGASAIVFEEETGHRIELDLRSDTTEPDHHFAEEMPARGVGRPKLGVVAREVTLLPRHWDWLSRQPGGASVALRRLIDEARHQYAERDAVRASRESAYGVMSVLASELPGFEEATRALFAGSRERFETYVSDWPADVTAFVRRLAAPGWTMAAPLPSDPL